MRALVTGAAGFIGSHLTDSLLADGHDVLGIDCFNDNYDIGLKRANVERARLHAAFRLEVADLARADLAALVEDRDVIFHLAAEPGVRPSWGPRFDRYVHNNVVATQRLLDASATRPERRFVYASSSSVYGDAQGLPTSEDVLPAPALSLWRDEARRRAALPALPRGARGGGGRAALLLRLRAAPAPGHGVPSLLPRGAGRRADPAVRRRPPDARLHLRRRRRRTPHSPRRALRAPPAASTTSAAGRA